MPYVPALDGIRAIAIFLVLAFHARVPGFRFGYVGVDVFFVLSGFLISGILLRQIEQTGTVQFRQFYIRRFFRLTPALLAMLTVYIVIGPMVWPLQNHLRDAALAALYVSDYSKALYGAPDTISHTWSLSVEEHFYLLWPPVLLALHGRYKGSRLAVVIAFILVTCLAWRWAWLERGATWNEIYYRFDTRLTGMIAGSLLAVLIHHRPSIQWMHRYRYYIYFLPLLLILTLDQKWGSTWMLRWGFTIVELGSASVIVAVMFRSSCITYLLSQPVMVWVGKHSYAIYLWHYPIMRHLREQGSWEATILIGLPLSLLLAWLSAHTIERLGYAVRDRLSPPAGVRSGRTA